MQEILGSLVWEMFSEDGMKIKDITRHVSEQPDFLHLNRDTNLIESKINDILIENRQKVIKEQIKYHACLSRYLSFDDPASYFENYGWEDDSYLADHFSMSPIPYWRRDEQNTYFKKNSNVRECVAYVIRNLFELQYTEMFLEENKATREELKGGLEKKLAGEKEALFSTSADETQPFATQLPHLQKLEMKDFSEAKMGMHPLSDREIHKLRDQIRKIIIAIKVFPCFIPAMRGF
jgi:hypothetical protein